MITEWMVKKLKKNLSQSTYSFAPKKDLKLLGNFGIYLHVPFCKTTCQFCPFYKEIHSKPLEKAYLDALYQEIEHSPSEGIAKWFYIGGGTPNLLSASTLGTILETVNLKFKPKKAGVELHPFFAKKEDIEKLAQSGFNAISFGIESLNQTVLKKNSRNSHPIEHIENLLKTAHEMGLWTNLDLMIGLPSQKREDILSDILTLTRLEPKQLTLYPYMIIRDVPNNPSFTEKDGFNVLEEARPLLLEKGYQRTGIWTFAKGKDIYDSSRDELVENYLGFGPAAFSTFENQKVVNPDLYSYILNKENNQSFVFQAPKTSASDAIRHYSRKLYDLQFTNMSEHPRSIQNIHRVLGLFGYHKKNTLTQKGKYLAHVMTKGIVESLPFPLLDSRAVENPETYEAYKNEAIERLNS